MKKHLLGLLFVIYNVILGFVAFIKVHVLPDKVIDHSGLQSFIEPLQQIAVEVKLRFNAWLSVLRANPA